MTDSTMLIAGAAPARAVDLPARWPSVLRAEPWIHDMARDLGVAPPAADDPVFDSLKHALTLDDRLADSLAGWVRSAATNRALFNQVLDTGLPASNALPAPLADFVDAIVENRPGWVDRDAMMRGQEAHIRLSTTGQLASGTLGLLAGYRNAAVAKSLVTTGSLVKSSARRLAETTRFFNDVVTSDGMPRFSNGFKAAVRVRLVHSFVRFGLSRSPRWRPDLWGMPIAILDSLGTALTFWVPVVRAAPVFGYSVDRDEAYGMMMLWNYVAWIQGVPEDILPRSLDEAYRLYVAIMMLVGEPDDDSRRLAGAFMSVAEQQGDRSSWLQGKLVHGAAAALIPREHLAGLGIGDTLFRYWPALARPKMRRQERRRLRDPAFHKAMVARGRLEIAQALPSDLREGHSYDPDHVIRDKSAFG